MIRVTRGHDDDARSPKSWRARPAAPVPRRPGNARNAHRARAGPAGRDAAGLPARLRLVVTAAVAALLAAGCGGPMKQSELADSIDTIESSAAEGSLIASHVYTDKTKTTFVRVRAREIGGSSTTSRRS